MTIAKRDPAITIVGVGALGSHVAMFLRNEGLLRLVDFDRVEQKNVLAQFHSKPNVGKLKSQALQQTMNFLWGVKPEVFNSKLTEGNTDVLLEKSDLVIDCLDNGHARRLVQGYVRSKLIPCLHGALAADGGFGRVIWDEGFVVDDEAGAGVATCEGGEHLPFIGVASTTLARAAQIFLKTGKKVGFSITPVGVVPT